MPSNHGAEKSSDKVFGTYVDDNGARCGYFQAILLASDCNPRSSLVASRNVPLISVKDRKQGSLRLGELIKVKTAIAVGIKAKGNSINRLIEEALTDNKINSTEDEAQHVKSVFLHQLILFSCVHCCRDMQQDITSSAALPWKL